MRSDSLAPPTGLSPFEQLIVAAAIHLGKRRERITPEALADLVGLPVAILNCMYWKIRPVGDAP